VLPDLRDFVVTANGWLSDRDFANCFAIVQAIPGPNVVSVTVCIGAKFRGPAGALAALAGFILVPWTVGFALGAFFLSYAQAPALQGILRGVGAAAAGLIIATGIRLLLPHRHRPIAVGFAALAFVGLALVKIPLLIVVLGLVPLSIALARAEPAPAQ
ncbi:MAG: chromate transporter, partial [Alphaproteobacteria bacterium]|nr:chromate transporter [Alphaproteobacteria bacterium]